jgi:hypothetical protein
VRYFTGGDGPQYLHFKAIPLNTIRVYTICNRYMPYAAFCRAAQRLLTASATRFLPSGLRFRFFLVGFAMGTFAFGLPGPLLTTVSSLSNARACVNIAIYSSISARILVSPTVPPFDFDRIELLPSKAMTIRQSSQTERPMEIGFPSSVRAYGPVAHPHCVGDLPHQ